MKREKERVGHYLHASSEQKLLEVNNFLLMEIRHSLCNPAGIQHGFFYAFSGLSMHVSRGLKLLRRSI